MAISEEELKTLEQKTADLKVREASEVQLKQDLVICKHNLSLINIDIEKYSADKLNVKRRQVRENLRRAVEQIEEELSRRKKEGVS